MTIVYWALALFLIGALGGLVMAARSFKGQSIPVVLAITHGILGATGLVLLIVAVLAGAVPGMIKIALGFLIVAALGGFYLLSFHIRKEQHPQAVIVVHALIAAIGVFILLWSIIQQPAMA